MSVISIRLTVKVDGETVQDATHAGNEDYEALVNDAIASLGLAERRLIPEALRTNLEVDDE